MPLLLTALALIGLTWLAQSKEWSRVEVYSRVAFFIILLAWLWISADLPSLGSGEEGLLLWIAYGLGVALLGELLQISNLWLPWAYATYPLSALLFAMGLDVLRPNAYAYTPAAIIAILVGLVTARLIQKLFLSLQERGWGAYKPILAIYTLSIALMLYAAFFKLMDRNWLLPWSYLMALGALLISLSQVWIAWDQIRDLPVVQLRNSTLGYQLGSFLIVLAAFSHYQQYF